MAVHFNYGLRGHEADEDEAFVTAVCRHRSIPLLVERPRLAREAPRGRRSVQEAARELRYRLLDELAHRHGCDRIAIGHTADDQAETVLMWMLRGAGTTGLGGMRHDRRGSRAHLIRPLLDCSRKAVLEYLQSEGLAYRQDSSNQSRAYRRNRIRHDVLPLLKELNPAIIRVLGRQADLLAEDEQVLRQESDRQLSRLLIKREPDLLAIQRDDLLALPTGIQRRIIRQILQTHHTVGKAPTLRQVSAALKSIAQTRPGTSFRVAHVIITRDSDQVIVTPVPASDRTHRNRFHKVTRSSSPTTSLSLSIPSTVIWPPSGQRITLRWESLQPWEEPPVRKRQSLHMAFDAGRFTHALSLRSWQPGDTLCPAGMGGHRKKLQDLFTDMKIPRTDRNRLPILVAPEGILWVVGRRADHRFVPDANTKQVLIVEVETAEQALE
jgi:tRNA(Ile)-lysidine synthase